MNKDQLTSRIHSLSVQTGASFNTILTLYFLESILKRIVISDQRHRFTFKGGFLLASSLGLTLRTTKDIDLHIQGLVIEPISLTETINGILALDLGDQIHFQIMGYESIRETDPYGGMRVKINCKLENIKQTVAVDLATGDPITPGAIQYPYKTLFSQETLMISSYNIETILAEKFHTIIDRGLANSRSKDFYDIFSIIKLKTDQIDVGNLRAAFQNTFQYRNTPFDLSHFSQVLSDLKDNPLMQTRWNNFRKQNNFSIGIDYEDTIQACNVLLELINDA